MPETTSGGKDGGAEAARAARLGSARADFVASLGRRVSELRSILSGLEQEPGSPRLRDDLRRRVHALSAGARLLRFAGMATALAEAERILERAASVGGLANVEVRDISEIFENLPSFAENEPTYEQRATERPPSTATIGETAIVPPTVLVIGPSGLADAITHNIDQPADNEMECERCDTAAAGLELARSLEPDVVVVDADLPGAKDLVEKLGRDPLTDPTPTIVVGTWATPEEGAKWVASGAAQALAKPVSPHDLRKACMDLSSDAAESAHHGPLGRATVEQLTTLIMSEVKRGLPDALVQGKSTPIELGDGSDILAAVWGAVARVRDLIMIKSGGMVRFSNQGPEGALPIAPWWGDSPTPVPGGDAKRSAAPRLEGRRVVVADDDPAVTWFIGGLLRAAGAEVREAHDGERALELCFRLGPDLVISDVLMPKLDGFALCRALKRDIALRDVPVILLSWKEDLLQRLRDLGADADGYLRKEASAQAILQRVHEVLRARLRIEARMKGEGEVRGKLDGVTPATLLQTLARVRPNARLCIRDASFLYEVEMRYGAPKSATRTTSDGAFQRGKEVFAALLGVRTGRYVVSRADGPARGTLDGNLAMQMEAPLAHARAALRLLGGTRLLEVTRVSIALDRVLAYLGATPEPARSLLHRLAKGASPRELILGSEVAPREVEELLCDLAARGAVIGVVGAEGNDLLGPALEHELDSIRRGGTPSHPPRWETKPATEQQKEWSLNRLANPEPQPQPQASVSPPGTTLPSGSPAQPASSPASSTASNDTVPAVPVGAVIGRLRIGPPVVPPEGRTQSRSSSVPSAPQINVSEMPLGENDSHDRTPSSLEAALIREISERTPDPAAIALADGATSIVDTSELKARVSATPPLVREVAPAMPSLPPDAIVPGSSSEDRIKTSDLSMIAAMVPAGSSDHRIVPALAGTSGAHKSAPETPSLGAAIEMERPLAAALHEPDEPSHPSASARSKGSGSRFIALGALVAFGVLIFLLRNWGDRGDESRPDKPAPSTSPRERQLLAPPVADPAAILPAATVAPVTSSPTESAIVAVDGASSTPAPSASAMATSGEDLPLPAGAVIAPGQGLLDIETGAREAIFVDNVELGRGPFLRLTLTPGIHEIRLRAHGEERIRFVLIRSARRTRLPLSSVWTR